MARPDQSDMVVFNHIPKTAGTSVADRIRAGLQPEDAYYFLDRSLVGGYDDFEAIDPRVRGTFVFDPAELPDADFVSGHIAPGTTFVRYPEARHVTVLRNPRARVISQWVHGRSLTDLDLRHWGPAYAFRVARWPLHRYLDHAMVAPNVDNTITRFLAWPQPGIEPTSFIAESDDETIFKAAVDTLDAFVHVNVVENPSFMAELNTALGIASEPVRLNDRSSFPPVVATDLAGELDGRTREILDHRTRLDTRLWKHVAEQVLPGADHQGILDEGLDDSVRRYSAMAARRPSESAVKRAAELAFRVKSRLDPRLRDYR